MGRSCRFGITFYETVRQRDRKEEKERETEIKTYLTKEKKITSKRKNKINRKAANKGVCVCLNI